MVSRGLMQLCTIILAVVLVRVISKDLYGTYRQVILLVGLVEGIFLANIASSLFYFLPAGDRQRRPVVLAQTLLVSLVVGGLAAVVLLVGSEPISRLFASNDLLGSSLRVFCLYVVFRAVLSVVTPFMVSLDRPVRAGIYAVVGTVLRVGLTTYGFVTGWSIEATLLLAMAGEALLMVVAAVDMFRLCRGGTWGVEFSLLWEQVSYVWPLCLTSGIALLSRRLDQALISATFETSDYAVYACGAMELPVMSLVVSSISTALMPSLVEMGREGRIPNALSLWQNGARKAALVIFPCFAFCLFHARDIMVLLYGEGFARAAWPFAVYLFLLPLHITIYGTFFRAMGETRPITVAGIIALVSNISISSFLIWLGRGSLLSFVGPAVGTVCCAVLSTAYKARVMSRLARVRMLRVLPVRELACLMSVSVGSCAVFLIPSPVVMPKWAVLIAHAGMYLAAVLGVLVGFRMLRTDELRLLGPVGAWIERLYARRGS